MLRLFSRFVIGLAIAPAVLFGWIETAGLVLPRNEIIYARYDRTEVDIFRLDVMHRLAVNITRRQGYDGTPSWSPDGRLIAFTSDRAGPLSVYVMDSRGKEVRSIVPVELGVAFSARWSSDGQRLYFFRSAAGRDDIYQVDLDGSNFQQITALDARDSIRRDLDMDPQRLNSSVSPDGRYYLYVMFRAGDWGIYMAEGAGGEARHLADAGQQYTDPPTWSADGEQVTFVALTESGFDLFSVPSEPGSIVTRLTQDRAQEAYPSWRP